MLNKISSAAFVDELEKIALAMKFSRPISNRKMESGTDLSNSTHTSRRSMGQDFNKHHTDPTPNQPSAGESYHVSNPARSFGQDLNKSHSAPTETQPVHGVHLNSTSNDLNNIESIG